MRPSVLNKKREEALKREKLDRGKVETVSWVQISKINLNHSLHFIIIQ